MDDLSAIPKGEAIPEAYLKRTGWWRSHDEKLPIDADGNPLPWYTYPAIYVIQRRVRRSFNVFEFGAGNSTLWWARRSASVHSIEHNQAWVKLLKPKLPKNATVTHVPLVYGGDYCRSAGETPQYDVIVIDGRDRVNCALNCLPALKPNGVIVWDNSERPTYQQGYDHLSRNGFRRLDFVGLGPINEHGWITSVFYRPDNCFDL